MSDAASGYQQQQQAPNSDIVRNLELGILSLHSHLKTLEGKYIDLANYYKQELIQANQSDETINTTNAGGGVTAASQTRLRPQSSSANQRRMNADPFESFLMDMGYRVRDMGGDPDDPDANDDNDEAMDAGPVQCRTSQN